MVTGLALLMVVAVVALVAWALQLMQAANDRQEFSLMLAGCMVCSAAVGLATVMVITFSSPDRLQALGFNSPVSGAVGLDSIEDSDQWPDSFTLPWDG